MFGVGCVTTSVAVTRPKGGSEDAPGAPAFVGRASEVGCSVAETGPGSRLTGSEDEVAMVTEPRRP